MIVYKVVSKVTRFGTNVALHLDDYNINMKDLRKQAKTNKFIKHYLENYTFRYLKASRIKAPENSLGIFCFTTLEYAQEFLDSQDNDNVELIIIKVEGIGGHKRPRRIGDGVINSNRFKHRYTPIDGTICFPEVRVLE